MIALKSNPEPGLSVTAAAVAFPGSRRLSLSKAPSQSNHIGTEEGQLSHNVIPVKSERFKVNSELRKVVARALRIVAADAASGAPAKQIASETGIGASEIYELRSARRNRHLDVWYALLLRRPDLKPIVERITNGTATSQELNDIVRGMK